MSFRTNRRTKKVFPIIYRHSRIPGQSEMTFGVGFNPKNSPKCDVMGCEDFYPHIHIRRDALPRTKYEELVHLRQPRELFGKYSQFGRTPKPTEEDVIQYVLNPAEVEAKTFAHAIAREKKEEDLEDDGEIFQ